MRRRGEGLFEHSGGAASFERHRWKKGSTGKKLYGSHSHYAYIGFKSTGETTLCMGEQLFTPDLLDARASTVSNVLSDS